MVDRLAYRAIGGTLYRRSEIADTTLLSCTAEQCVWFALGLESTSAV